MAPRMGVIFGSRVLIGSQNGTHGGAILECIGPHWRAKMAPNLGAIFEILALFGGPI